MKKSKSGFTLIELLVVVVVIGILAGIVLVSYNSTQARSRDARRKTDVANIIKAMELYYGDKGEYPRPAGATGSAINGAWYVSADSSWDIFNTTMTNADAIDALPVDPRNTPGNTQLANIYSYAVYVNGWTYCGASPGQMYLIIWRYETAPKERSSEGNCTTNALGDGYYNSGNSYYRNSKI